MNYLVRMIRGGNKMKTSLALLITSFTLGVNALAAQKICFGSGDSSDAVGVILSVDVREDLILIKSLKGGAFDGSYKSNGATSVSNDGKTYLQFEGSADGYFNEFSVCSSLLEARTTGLLKVRSTGEGWLDSSFTCLDTIR
jgi:hypothetical protein